LWSCLSGSGIASSSHAERSPTPQRTGLCRRRSLKGNPWIAQGSPHRGYPGSGTSTWCLNPEGVRLTQGLRKSTCVRFPQRIRQVEFGPQFSPTARFKPSPSGMNRSLAPQPRVAAARRTLGYESMSLQDMAVIHVVFGRMAECPLSLGGALERPRLDHLSRR
jgi:hypothetical protein